MAPLPPRSAAPPPAVLAGMAALCLGCAHAPTWSPDPSALPGLWDEDRPVVAALRARGTPVAGAHVEVWLPRDALAPDRVAALVSALDRGVAAADALIGPQPWRARTPGPVVFYFGEGRFISHAPTGRLVLVPLQQLLEDRAPWLHEVMHVLLRSKDGDWLASVDEATADREMPLWLLEGVADVLAQQLSESGLDAYRSPFGEGRLAAAGAECRERAAASEAGQAALARVGTPGRMDELFGPDRFQYARVFYPCARALVAFLARSHGLQAVLAAAADFRHEHEALARLTGTSVPELRRRWLQTLEPHPGP